MRALALVLLLAGCASPAPYNGPPPGYMPPPQLVIPPMQMPPMLQGPQQQMRQPMNCSTRVINGIAHTYCQ